MSYSQTYAHTSYRHFQPHQQQQQQQPPQFQYPPYSYHQPQQQPNQVQHSPASFRQEYTARLNQLTVNSRPIIQDLSMLAQDNARFADIVTQCIEAHIRRVPPWAKLPSFYLLDAISKNVFEPYARHFAAFVVPLYLETYRQIPPDTQSKMTEMLLTWRHGSPTGLPLFGTEVQMAIERGVWGTTTQEGNGFYSGAGQITTPQVLTELEFTLNQKERAVQANPYDAEAQKHIKILNQLRVHIQAGVPQDDLQQILTQLRTLARPAPVQPPLPQASTSWAPGPYAQYPRALPPPPPPPQPQPQMYSYQYDYAKPEPVNHVLDSSSTTPQPSSVSPPDITQLLKTLVRAGVVPQNATPRGAGQTAAETKAIPEDPAKASARNYRRAILSQPIKLNSSDIVRTRLNVVDFLYGQLPSQCKQCALRFADDAIGRKKMENHLDMHFRQNRKASQTVGRGHSRSWFVGVEDWVHDMSSAAKGKGREDGSRPLSAKAAAAVEAADRDAALRAQFVVVPAGDEAKTISCPVCKETLKSEFLEDDEEWVWKNAIMKDERVYHATCHVEALASTTSLAARLRTEAATRSRSATPETRLSKSPVVTPTKAMPASSNLKTELPTVPSPQSAAAGVKRKVSDTSSLNPEADDTPPMKKMTFAVAV